MNSTPRVKRAYGMILFVMLISLLFFSGCRQEETVVNEEINVEIDKTLEMESEEQIPIDLALETPTFLEGLSIGELLYIENIRGSGGLKIATRESKTVYFEEVNGDISGFHYNLADSFAKALEVDLRIKKVRFHEYFEKDSITPDDVKTNPNTVYEPDLFSDVDIFCDNLTVLPWREKIMSFIKIAPVNVVVLTRKGAAIESTEDLNYKRLAIETNTSYESAIQSYAKNNSLQFEIYYVDSGVEATQAVVDGTVDFTVKDSNKALGEIKSNEALEMGLSVSELQYIGWAVSRDDMQLKNILEKYIEYAIGNGQLDFLWESEYGMTLRDYSTILDVIDYQD